MFDDTTTLRVKIEPDTASVKAFAAKVVEEIGSALGGIGGGGRGGKGGGGGGGSTTSTAGPGSGGGSGGASVGGPGSAGGPAGNSGGGGSTSSTAGPRAHSPRPRDMEGRFLPAGSVNYQSYLKDRVFGLTANDYMAASRPQAAIPAIANMINRRTSGLAQSRIEEIERVQKSNALARAAGLPEQELPEMGNLAYAPFAGALMGAVAGNLAKRIEEGGPLQLQYTERMTQMAPALAEYRLTRQGWSNALGRSQSSRSKAWTANIYEELAKPSNGSLDFGEASQAIAAMSRIGFNKGFKPIDWGPLVGAGVSANAISSFMSLGRLGATNYDPTRIVSAGQAAGLTGSGIDALLRQIAAHTYSMASRGFKVDMSSLTALIDKAAVVGLPLEPTARGIGQMQSKATSLYDMFMGPYDQMAQAEIMRGALDQGGGAEGVAKALANYANNPDKQLALLGRRDGVGRMMRAAYTGMPLGTDLGDTLGVEQPETRKIRAQSDMLKGLFDERTAKASREAKHLRQTYTVGQYENYQEGKYWDESASMAVKEMASYVDFFNVLGAVTKSTDELTISIDRLNASIVVMTAQQDATLEFMKAMGSIGEPFLPLFAPRH